MPNELDINNLRDIFEAGEEVDREEQQKMVDFETEIDYSDPIDALKKNIHNANQILEKIQDEMNHGNFSARLVEVAGNLINSITASSKEVINEKNNTEYMEVRRALVLLKEKELQIKEQKVVKSKNIQNNVLVASREDLLKLMQGKTDVKQITNE